MRNLASYVGKLTAEWFGLYNRAALIRDELQEVKAINIRLDEENRLFSEEIQRLRKRIAELEKAPPHA